MSERVRTFLSRLESWLRSWERQRMESDGVCMYIRDRVCAWYRDRGMVVLIKLIKQLTD